MTPDAPGKPSRRAHAKTRSGCSKCKRRKVKCGEERPSCRNCSRRGESCDLPDDVLVPDAAAARPPASTLAGSGQAAPSPSRAPPLSDGGAAMGGGLTLLDMELLHQYSISTCLTLTSDPVERSFFQVNVPQIGFSHPYVLYSILALAASHLAHFRPESRQYYYSEATARHTIATSIATPLLSNVSAANSVPMYCFSSLTMFISFATLRDGDHFLDTNDFIPGWLSLFRGLRSILEHDNRAILSSPIAFLFRDRPDMSKWETKQLDHDALNDLHNYIDTTTSIDEQTRPHLSAVVLDLKRAFFWFYAKDLGNEGKIRSLFSWLYKIPDEYIEMLRQRNSNALCVLGFFCVLLHRLEYNWWLKGWGIHLIDRIYQALDNGHRFWIRWPIQEIGWIPP